MYYKKKYPLYAVTNHKEYLESFMNVRDMNKFILVKHNMSKSEYSEFTRGKEDKILSPVPIVTRADNEEGAIEVEMILTNYEEDLVKSDGLDLVINVLNGEEFIPPEIFKKKVKKALYKIDFYPLLTIMMSQEDYNTCQHIYGKDYMDDIEAPDIKVSELDILLEYFGGTFDL